MKFNYDMLSREAFDHLINDTVPHEIAHIVCFMKPALGKNHDYGWTRVCVALGGTGDRTHKEDVVYGKGVTYEYISSTGHKHRVSQAMHNKMQNGETYRYRKGGGTITKNSAHSIVGVRGQTLAAPVRHVEAKVPEVQPKFTIDTLAPERIAASPDVGRVIGGLVIRTIPPVPKAPVATNAQPGESKASIARRIMLSGTAAGHDYEKIISAIMHATGHDRQLARATYKANAHKVGIAV